MAAEGVALAMFYKFHSVEVHFFYNLLTHAPSVTQQAVEESWLLDTVSGRS